MGEETFGRRDIFDAALHRLIPPDPRDFPRWARRAFVLLLPVSGPLWVLWFVVGLVTLTVGFSAFIFGVLVLGALAWAISPLVWFCELAFDLWSTPDDV